MLYFAISLIYRFGLSAYGCQHFEVSNLLINCISFIQSFIKAVCAFCRRYMGMIPMNFFLAFYVSQVVTRWWAQWNVSTSVDSTNSKLRYSATVPIKRVKDSEQNSRELKTKYCVNFFWHMSHFDI